MINNSRSHVTPLYSYDSIFIDQLFTFTSNFPGMRLLWECYDQSQETVTVSLDRNCLSSFPKRKDILKIDGSSMFLFIGSWFTQVCLISLPVYLFYLQHHICNHPSGEEVSQPGPHSCHLHKSLILDS